VKKTIVLGASPNPDRFSYKATLALKKNGYEVFPLGIKTGTIGDLQIINDLPVINDIHTVTIYINKTHQKQYFGYILKLKPQRVIFNPGTYNKEFMNLLGLNGIEIVEDCTLVMLSMKSF